MQQFKEQFLRSADGLELYYRVYGDNPSRSAGASTDASASEQRIVLCLPGLTRNSRDFDFLARDLSARYTVITPDLRGRGRSAYDPHWQNYNPAKYVEDAFHLLDSLQITQCAVIGTSLGGLMGMIMGALQPQRLAGLVINDIGPELDPRGIERIKGYAGKLPAVMTWPEAAAQARHVHGSALPGLDDEDWMQFARRTYRDDNGVFRPDVDPNIARAFSGAPAPDLWPIYQLLASIPVLAIRGELSDLFSEATLQRMRELKPDLRTLVVPQRGHAPMLDEPACRSAIASFLAGLSWPTHV